MKKVIAISYTKIEKIKLGLKHMLVEQQNNVIWSYETKIILFVENLWKGL